MLSALLLTALLPAAAPRPAYLRELLDKAKQEQLAEAPQWLKLGHWEPASFSKYKSLAASHNFFLAEGGRRDPEAELEATLSAFFQPATPSKEEERATHHPQCRFTGRYHWLKRRLNFDPARLKEQPCPLFETWRAALRPRSLTVVFASAYLNNPSSMFGHTFLLLNREEIPTPGALTSYSVNFSATPWTSNPLLYAIVGLTGGFDGYFTTLPYYLKIKEYGDMERRDLWEYDLNLAPEQLELLLRHLYELGEVSFPYYYLDDNCSYQLLALIEVARPELPLVSSLTGSVVPADTLRVLFEQPGLVRARRFRPSRYAQLMAERADLSSQERAWVDEMAGGDIPAGAAAAPPLRQARMLQAAQDLHRLRHGEKRDEEPTDAVARKLMIARARLRLRTEPIIPPEPGAPEEAHKTSAFYVFGGGSGQASGAFVELGILGSLRDQLARPDGYVDGSAIQLLRADLRLPIYSEGRGRPYLERMDFIRIDSMTPMNSWLHPLSWRLDFRMARARDSDCKGSSCLFVGINGGPGVAGKLFDALTLFAYLDADFGLGRAFDDSYRLTLGASAGPMLQLPGFRLRASAGYAYPLLGDAYPRFLPGVERGALFKLQAEVAVDLSADFELRVKGHAIRGYQEAAAGLRLAF